MNSSDYSMESGFDYRSLLPTSNNHTEESDDTSCLPSLTFRERALGCGTCMVAGYLLSLGSFWRIRDLLTGDPVPFVLNATIGNIIALLGSCFFSGPQAQFTKMWKDQRRTASLLYLGSLLGTLLCIVIRIPLQRLILLLLIVVQYVAIFWYCISYIPFAQDAVAGFVQRCLQRE